MSRKRNEAFAQAVVGVFMIAVIALLAFFTIVISGVSLLGGGSRAKMTVLFDNVGGLKDHDSVMYRGTKVGTVERVEVTPTNLVVKVDVDANVVLRRGYRIFVRNLSMLGGNYLQMDEGTGEVLGLSAVVFRGEPPSDWMQDVSKIARSMNELVNRPEMREIVTNVAAVTAKTRAIAERVDAVLARIEKGDGMVGKLVSGDARLYDDFEKTARNLNEITDRVNRGEGLVGRMLAKDDTVYAGLSATVSNVNAIVDRVGRGEGFAGRMFAKDDTLYRDVRDSVAAFRKACEAADMSGTKEDIRRLTAKGDELVDNLNAVAARVRRGEGTVGRLMADDRMYGEVEGLIRDCRQIIDNYRDTTPIAAFSSLLTGAL